MATILVIDDDQQIREFVRQTLERSGYQVALAADGREGQKRLNKGGIDLVICDLFMPDQDGLQTIRELRKTTPGLPIIAASGAQADGLADYLAIAGKIGAAATLAKPFLPAALRELVARLLPQAVAV